MRVDTTGIGQYAGSKIPEILKKSIEGAIASGNYLNKSDFIRDAIREKLQREGFLQLHQKDNPKILHQVVQEHETSQT